MCFDQITESIEIHHDPVVQKPPVMATNNDANKGSEKISTSKQSVNSSKPQNGANKVTPSPTPDKNGPALKAATPTTNNKDNKGLAGESQAQQKQGVNSSTAQNGANKVTPPPAQDKNAPVLKAATPTPDKNGPALKAATPAPNNGVNKGLAGESQAQQKQGANSSNTKNNANKLTPPPAQDKNGPGLKAASTAQDKNASKGTETAQTQQKQGVNLSSTQDGSALKAATPAPNNKDNKGSENEKTYTQNEVETLIKSVASLSQKLSNLEQNQQEQADLLRTHNEFLNNIDRLFDLSETKLRLEILEVKQCKEDPLYCDELSKEYCQGPPEHLICYILDKF